MNITSKKILSIWITVFTTLILTSINTYANTNSSIIDCSRNGHFALKTADNYFLFLELKKRKFVEGDFEKYAADHEGIFLTQLAQDDLNLLYEGKIKSPALFGAHVYNNCMEPARKNNRWTNPQSVPLCFKNLETANSIANAKRIDTPRSEVITYVRKIGGSHFIDNVMGLEKINEIIDATYKTSNATEEFNLHETMILQCLQSSKIP